MSAHDELVGQWFGVSEGDPSGIVVLDVEKNSGGVVGVASLLLNGDSVSTIAELNLTHISEEPSFQAKIYPFSLSEARILQFAELESLGSEVSHSEVADFVFGMPENNAWEVSWKTDQGTFGKAKLERKPLGAESAIEAETEVRSWKDFKEWVCNNEFGEFVFRGQTKPYPLQTSFHRTNRKILNFYSLNDIPAMHRAVTGASSHLFELERPQQFGAFLSLLQHHGFPTPLLDWTYSPHVASWFAFRGLAECGEKPDTVRVFALNKRLFRSFNQFQHLNFVPPHITILETLAIENNRVTSQQGLLTLTNLHNIEAHIQKLELDSGKRLLYAFDIPAIEASAAMNELALMGITRSTMFPGIESICLDARERLFDVP